MKTSEKIVLIFVLIVLNSLSMTYANAMRQVPHTNIKDESKKESNSDLDVFGMHLKFDPQDADYLLKSTITFTKKAMSEQKKIELKEKMKEIMIRYKRPLLETDFMNIKSHELKDHSMESIRKEYLNFQFLKASNLLKSRWTQDEYFKFICLWNNRDQTSTFNECIQKISLNFPLKSIEDCKEVTTILREVYTSM